MFPIELRIYHAIVESIDRDTTPEIRTDSTDEFVQLCLEAFVQCTDCSDVISEPSTCAQLYWGEDVDGREWSIEIYLEE